MSYKTIYARITPVNGVVNEKYSVAVSGVTANVDGQKTWLGNGAMNFAITPTSPGTMSIIFKNDTLNQIIGTRVISTTEDITILSISGATIKTENYESQDYNIIWGMNTWDLFVSIKGREPRAGEHVYWYAPGNIAVVAPGTNVGGLHFDERWNVVSKISIENRGIILGRGSNGRGANVIGVGASFSGGPAIANLSTRSIAISNHKIIAGGGGGGASVSGTWNNVDGGHGAPWGDGVTSASIVKPGGGVHGGGGRYSGSGGGWGLPGKHNSEEDYRNWSNPGKVIYGPGVVTNKDGGITLGL